ncbi:MAG: hypothetical protein QXP02_01700 [Desulfurococcaceae archaeon]
MAKQYRYRVVEYVDEIVGDIVDELISKYYSSKVDDDVTYEKILYTIAKEIKKEVFKNNATIDDIANYLIRLRERKSFAKLILSYLIAKALEDKEDVESYATILG